MIKFCIPVCLELNFIVFKPVKTLLVILGLVEPRFLVGAYRVAVLVYIITGSYIFVDNGIGFAGILYLIFFLFFHAFITFPVN